MHNFDPRTALTGTDFDLPFRRGGTLMMTTFTIHGELFTVTFLHGTDKLFLVPHMYTH